MSAAGVGALTSAAYLSLQRAPSEDDPTIGLRVVVQPMIQWLWVGGAIMVLGTALSAAQPAAKRPKETTAARTESLVVNMWKLLA